MSMSAFNWNYPTLLSHRGAGKQAPENTLAAVRLGAQHGFKMMEYDVKLSRDGEAILLHDDDIDRTSNGIGLASAYRLTELLQFDFGSWLSPDYVAEPILTLNTMATYTIAQGICSNIEIKPETGFEAETGARIARMARDLWKNAALPPLLSSFSEITLEAAKLAAPELPRALLIEKHLPADYLERLERLGCVSLNLDNRLATEAIIKETLSAGYEVCIWTVNDPARARELIKWGCKGIVTDAIDTINPQHIF